MNSVRDLDTNKHEFPKGEGREHNRYDSRVSNGLLKQGQLTFERSR
jgi:hypothetical protein